MITKTFSLQVVCLPNYFNNIRQIQLDIQSGIFTQWKKRKKVISGEIAYHLFPTYLRHHFTPQCLVFQHPLFLLSEHREVFKVNLQPNVNQQEGGRKLSTSAFHYTCYTITSGSNTAQIQLQFIYDISFMGEISDFCCSVFEAFTLLECHMAQVGSCFLTFRDIVPLIPYSREKKSSKKKCFSLGKGTESFPEISVNNYKRTLYCTSEKRIPPLFKALCKSGGGVNL